MILYGIHTHTHTHTERERQTDRQRQRATHLRNLFEEETVTQQSLASCKIYKKCADKKKGMFDVIV